MAKKTTSETLKTLMGRALTAPSLLSNAIFTRTELLNQIIDEGGKDLDSSCGYPRSIDPEKYQLMYAREGVAARAVDVWPRETWSVTPEVYETEDPEQVTEFEERWNALEKKFMLMGLLSRADRLSGVGRFGGILFGLDDGKPLNTEVDGFQEEGGGTPHELLYIRTFHEPVLRVSASERDSANPRFGLPLFYNVTFQDDDNGQTISTSVHWHRILHVADNREMSEVFGVPRMQRVYNRLLDLRKVLGGSAEMFWKGGYPGYSLEVSGDDSNVELDVESIRAEFEKFSNDLQRYMALTGITTKSLAPQVADPTGHLEAQMDSIAISLGIPKRVLFGSEQAELASSQDSRTWNRRVAERQTGYITPYLIRPFVRRMNSLGILPWVEEFFIDWPDMNARTDEERAAITKSWAEGLAKYVQGGVDHLIPPEEFLSIFAELPAEQVRQISKALEGYIEEIEKKVEEQLELEKDEEGFGEEETAV